MRRRRTAARAGKNPLFHVLVTLGVSAGLEACGGISSSTSDPGGGTAGMSATVTCPSSCTSATAFTCDEPANRASCRCDETRPKRALDCADQYQFRCRADAPSDCNLLTRVDCFCDETALVPSDCQATGQFVCAAYYPEAATCVCEPTRPASEAECTAQGLYHYCRRSEPDVDCKCVTAIPIK